MPHSGTLASPGPAGAKSTGTERAARAPRKTAPRKTTSDINGDFARFRAQLDTYLKSEEVEKVAAAFAFSQEAHAGQMRSSGDPYISHPLAVAESLASWHMDAQALCAALLHD